MAWIELAAFRTGGVSAAPTTKRARESRNLGPVRSAAQPGRRLLSGRESAKLWGADLRRCDGFPARGRVSDHVGRPSGRVLAGPEPSPFVRRSFSTCHVLRPWGVRRVLLPSSSPPVAASPLHDQLSTPLAPTDCFRWARTFVAQSHGPLNCSPPVQIRPGPTGPAAGTFTPELAPTESPPVSVRYHYSVDWAVHTGGTSTRWNDDPPGPHHEGSVHAGFLDPAGPVRGSR